MLEPLLIAALIVPSNPQPQELKTYAHTYVMRRGWDDQQWQCLDRIIHRESRWTYNAKNGNAYGFAQIMNLKPNTPIQKQMERLMGYLAHRYDDNACNAWAHHKQRGWY